MKSELPEEISQQIDELCRRYQITELSLFGSRVRGDFKTASDFDFLVEFAPDAYVSLITLGNIQNELESILETDVDLVPKNGLKPLIRNQVLSEAEIIYAE
jgi:predicted nucleotidyltransferase